MQYPTFGSALLCNRAGREIIGSPRCRCYLESFPGVEGDLLHLQARGGRRIKVLGQQTITAASADNAMQVCKILIRNLQSNVGTVDRYVGTDGFVYEGTLLLSYRPGVVQVVSCGEQYRAFVSIVAELHQARS